MWQEKAVTSSLVLLQCLVLAFPASISASELLAHVADFQIFDVSTPAAITLTQQMCRYTVPKRNG